MVVLDNTLELRSTESRRLDTNEIVHSTPLIRRILYRYIYLEFVVVAILPNSREYVT